jgi:MFS family permease
MTTGPLGVLTGGAVLGLGIGSAQPALMALTTDRVPPAERGKAMGTFYTAWELAIASGAAGAGWLLNITDFAALFLVAAYRWRPGLQKAARPRSAQTGIALLTEPDGFQAHRDAPGQGEMRRCDRRAARSMAAALSAEKAGADVILIDRGPIGMGTNSALSNAAFSGPISRERADEYVDLVLQIGKRLNRVAYVRQVARGAPAAVAFLESLGLEVVRTPGQWLVRSAQPEVIRSLAFRRAG